jgi:carbon storage regulator
VLVLSRKPEQSVHLGDDIIITVLSIDGERVKLGIDAPRAVSVLRHEVFEQIQSANLGAASAAVTSLETITSALRTR